MTSTELELATGSGYAPVPMTAAIVSDLQQQVQALDAAYTIAKSVCQTAFAPKDFRGKPEDGAIAILYGSRLYLDAIQSMQNVFIIHGRPSTYAIVMKAALSVKGHTVKTIESSAERCVVRGWRAGAAEDDYEESVWDMDRVRAAGYDKTNEMYRKEPQNMLYARATAECCRRTAPEVLLGISEVAEARDAGPEPVRVKSERITADELLAESGGEPTADQPEAPRVQQWQAADGGPADADASEGEKPDTAPVDEPSVDAASEPAPEPATREQLQRLSSLLEREGLNSAVRKRKYLSEQFGRQINSARELTADEAVALTRYLENPEGERLDTVAEATVVGVAEAEAHATGGETTP
ncbi:hypothetical protein [Nocardia cyriacigeorgica]|uniref:hypothetical protein n=1 Tax=Nocardia cyriacigeorgica TaxID=135487 RepID=UPI0013D30E4C|nr:hypothetical protein [Nocardia cyriacigeorgica]NEW27275.1 hypothetical protein [Nocardia cyriacigeorgica]